MRRLSTHILSQQSFYPLFPPNRGTNVEHSMLQDIRLPVSPHILILPSDLKYFAKVKKNQLQTSHKCVSLTKFISDYLQASHGSIVINPERMSKGYFSRIRVESPSEGNYYDGKLDKYISAEVVKLC